MNDNRKALGKGLGSLIPMGSRREGGSRDYFECPLEDIVSNDDQPRKMFSQETLNELAASITSKGIIQPLIVRLLGNGKYELIAGERRFRAAKQAGLEKVPVVVKTTAKSESLELALIENIQRQDLNAIEEAMAYKELLSRHQYTQDELSEKLGKDRSTIANSLRLLKLPDKVREYVINNQISMGHARAILAVENRELQIQVAEDTIAHGLSVREVEVLTQKMKEQVLAQARGQVEEIQEKPDPIKEYTELLQQLENSLRQKVRIKKRAGRGELIIAFKGDEELKSLTDRLLR